MKNRFLLAAYVGVALLFAACSKEVTSSAIPEGAVRLVAESFVSQEGTKISVQGNTVQWVNGDIVHINGNEYTVIVDDENQTAYIDPSEHPIGTGELFAWYPNIFSEITFFNTTDYYIVFIDTLSSHIDSKGRQVLPLPMLARAEATGAEHTTLLFHHTSAAVNVMLWNATETPLTITQVKVRTSRYRLHGLVSVSTLPDPEASYEPKATDAPVKVVTVSFPDHGNPGALTIPAGDNTKSVQVPFAPIGEDDMTIEVYCTDGTHDYFYTHTASTPALARNQMLTARAKLSTSPGDHMTLVSE